jgi:hypothetical protein
MRTVVLSAHESLRFIVDHRNYLKVDSRLQWSFSDSTTMGGAPGDRRGGGTPPVSTSLCGLSRRCA